jgi:glutamate---cysteine ligase / carboxylate-amine ligase
MSWTPGEHRFGCAPDFSIGIEEELLLVDADRLCLKADSDRVLASLGDTDGGVKAEIFEAVIELISPPCQTVGAAVDSLAELRLESERAGAAMIASGTHPDGRFGDASLHDSPRYSAVEDALRGVLRTPTCALHVHVGMPDPESAIRVANALRVHVPLIDALTANSPFWHGVDSGLASARTAILRSYPRSEVPREFACWEEFCEIADDLARAAKVGDYTYFWWDVRPHPLLGTVEVRCADVQCTSQRTAAIAALIQSLAKLELTEGDCVLPRREALAEYVFAANRYGLRAEVPNRRGDLLPAREAAAEALALVQGHARELGCAMELEGVEEILRGGNGASRQRSAFGIGGMPALLTYLAKETHVIDRRNWTHVA